MEKEVNIRYGVVNVVERARYEKIFHINLGYALITFNEGEAIAFCKKKRNPNVIVEKIYDNYRAVNNKIEIFRGGVFKEGKNA